MSSQPPKVIELFPTDPDEVESDSSNEAKSSSTETTSVTPPMEVLYSAAQVEKLLDVTVDQLRRWSRSGLIQPSVKKKGRRFYTFQDLVGLRAAVALLRNGLSARQLGRALRALQQRLPQRSSPLAELRLSREGDSIVVRDDDKRFEAETGQFLLDFDRSELERQVVELIQPRRRPGTSQRQTAFDCYIEGCQLESRPEDMERAEDAYRRAIELDPELGCAYTNLGNLRYRAGSSEDAMALYTKAIEVDPNQPEAQYNLAFLIYEDGDLDEAIHHFERALDLDAEFADAHFNLAMALTESSQHVQAAIHFATYLELEPDGPWAEIAREELELQ